jgi:hypothetical protein
MTIGREAGRVMVNEDIRHILDHWPYEPGEIRVRRVIGADGAIKIQMRLVLGLLQMESAGRPDGQRPHGKESLLEYYEGKLADHLLRHDTEEGFTIGAQACAELREEGVQYYHRYLSNFILKEYAAVVRDTERNLRLLDFTVKYGRNEADRHSLEGYRPYILMMNARAKAHLALEEEELDRALAEVNSGLEKLRTFFSEHDQPQLIQKSNEVQALQELRDQLLSRKPRSRLDVLRDRLTKAVDGEDFETAARLRDEIRRLEESEEASEHPSTETT